MAETPQDGDVGTCMCGLPITYAFGWLHHETVLDHVATLDPNAPIPEVANDGA